MSWDLGPTDLMLSVSHGLTSHHIWQTLTCVQILPHTPTPSCSCRPKPPTCHRRSTNWTTPERGYNSKVSGLVRTDWFFVSRATMSSFTQPPSAPVRVFQIRYCFTLGVRFPSCRLSVQLVLCSVADIHDPWSKGSKIHCRCLQWIFHRKLHDLQGVEGSKYNHMNTPKRRLYVTIDMSVL